MIVWKLILAASLGLANPLAPRSFSIPNDNGFPNPSPQQELAIARQAGGKLPGGPLPTELGPLSTTALQLIASNELFETAFFSSLLKNVSSGAKGYAVSKAQYSGSVEILKTILAQEQQHAIASVAVLKSAKKFAPSACKYSFPVNDIPGALFLAETFTAVVLGALQGANQLFAKEGVLPLVRIVSSVIGQEGEQNGFYRISLDQVPSESPTLTFVPAAFAWSALQLFIVPGSCPFPLSKVNLPIFPPLNVNGGPIAKVKPKDQTLRFKANLKKSKGHKEQKGHKEHKEYKGKLYITYTTGQQLPYSVPAKNVRWRGSVVELEAEFPYNELVAAGFTHAALTTKGDFSDANDVPSHTLAAPAVIQVIKNIGLRLFG